MPVLHFPPNKAGLFHCYFPEESLFCDHEKNAKVKKPSNPRHTSQPILSLLCQWETFHVFKQWHSSLFANGNFFALS